VPNGTINAFPKFQGCTLESTLSEFLLWEPGNTLSFMFYSALAIILRTIFQLLPHPLPLRISIRLWV
jgi:hypothetical protein